MVQHFKGAKALGNVSKAGMNGGRGKRERERGAE